MWPFKKKRPAERSDAEDPREQLVRPGDSPGSEMSAVRQSAIRHLAQLAASAGISEKETGDLIRKWLEEGASEGLQTALKGLNEREKDSSTGSRQSASGASS